MPGPALLREPLLEEVTALAPRSSLLGVMISVLLKQRPSLADRGHCIRLGWGAGAMREMLPAFEERFGVFLLEGYGLTEGGIPLSNTLSERRIGSCGKPMPGYEVDVVDEWDNPVPPGSQGELVIRSRWPHTTMAGYYGMPDKTAENSAISGATAISPARTRGFFISSIDRRTRYAVAGGNISCSWSRRPENTHTGVSSRRVPVQVGSLRRRGDGRCRRQAGDSLTPRSSPSTASPDAVLLGAPFRRPDTQPLARTPTQLGREVPDGVLASRGHVGSRKAVYRCRGASGVTPPP